MTGDHPVTDPDKSVDNQQIERNKLAAERGWLADPPPHTPEPLPAHHVGKWWRMHGQMPPTK